MLSPVLSTALHILALLKPFVVVVVVVGVCVQCFLCLVLVVCHIYLGIFLIFFTYVAVQFALLKGRTVLSKRVSFISAPVIKVNNFPTKELLPNDHDRKNTSAKALLFSKVMTESEPQCSVISIYVLK